MKRKFNAKKSISFKTKLGAALTTAVTMSCVAHSYAYASAVDAKDALKKAGIEAKNLSGDANSLFADLKNVVYLVMAIGGFWGIFWLVFGGILLSGSGSNPQKRSQGFLAICMAALGIFVIYKAYDIAGWAMNLGSNK